MTRSYMEGPHFSHAVVHNSAADLEAIRPRSRPGPASGNEIGVFQTPHVGEYSVNSSVEQHQPNNRSSFSENSNSTPHGLTKPITIYFQNVRGLKSKIDEFYLACNELEYDVIILVETWLDERINSVQLFGDEYSVYRRDRDASNSIRKVGGGVLIAVRKCMDSSRWLDGDVSNLEQVFVRIRLAQCSLYIGAFYLPYERRLEHELMQHHISTLEKICAANQPHDLCFVAGDYNQSNLVWKTVENGFLFVDHSATHTRLRSEATVHEVMLDGMARCNLRQIQHLTNANHRILDLAFADGGISPPLISEAVDPFVAIDNHHPAWQCELKILRHCSFSDHSDSEALNYRKINFDALRLDLENFDWAPVLSCADTDEAVSRFGEIIRALLAIHTPRCRPASKPPWSNARLKRLKSKRNAALRNFTHIRSYRRKLSFKIASHDYRSYNKFRYSYYVRKTQQSLRHNPRKFWSFVKSKSNVCGLPTTMTYGEASASNGFQKCQLFAKHFASVFNESCSDNIDPDCLNSVPANLVNVDTFVITEDMFRKAIKKLKTSYSTGPDGIPAVLLKRFDKELAAPLLKIFNLSMQESKFPSEWKKSFMFPVFKKGEKNLVENYRGITSLSPCSKLLEIIVCDTIMFSCRNYISFEQHGFVPGRSVTTNLMEFVTVCFDNIANGLQVDAIYTDLKAAFDRIDHDIAIRKLSKLGFSDNICRWFESYLKNRTLQVKIGSSLSDAFSNGSGVPQGSNFGPAAFSLYFNDATSLFHGNCKLVYADDFKLFISIECLADCYVLQSHINTFSDWCRRNRMTLSVQKCSVISFHRKTSREVFNFDYAVNNHTLERVDIIKDLGVWLDSKLTFREHQNRVIDKANRQLGFMFKIAREFDDPFCLRALYCSLVRSHLEASAIIWAPYHQNWIQRIEKIQRKFVWYAGRNFNWADPANLPAYDHRCELLGLMTLEDRRKMAKALFAAKLLSGELDCPRLLEQLGAVVQARSLRPRTGFLHQQAITTEYMRNSPFRSMCATFNDFYDLFEFGESSSAFRSKLLPRLSVRGHREADNRIRRPRAVRH